MGGFFTGGARVVGDHLNGEAGAGSTTTNTENKGPRVAVEKICLDPAGEPGFAHSHLVLQRNAGKELVHSFRDNLVGHRRGRGAAVRRNNRCANSVFGPSSRIGKVAVIGTIAALVSITQLALTAGNLAVFLRGRCSSVGFHLDPPLLGPRQSSHNPFLLALLHRTGKTIAAKNADLPAVIVGRCRLAAFTMDREAALTPGCGFHFLRKR
jgi:hypothetical protein